MDLHLIVPVLVVLSGAVLTLVIGIFLPRRRQTWNALLAAGVLLLAMGAAAAQLGFGEPRLAFDGSYAADFPALTAQLVIMAGSLGVMALAVPVFRRDAREAEFYSLVLFATLGALLLAAAADLMEILLAVLMTSVAGYALVFYRRGDPLAAEATLKYYLVGALANIGLILGLVLLYGLSAGTLLGDLGAVDPDNRLGLTVALGLVLLGLGFKAGYPPAHTWIPDAYQGSTVPVALLLAILPKLAALLAVARLLSAFPPALGWPALAAGLATVAMTWGNLAAFRQTDIRRLLGYSSISQAGYLLMGVAALPGSGLALPGLLYFFAAYAAANLAAFAVIQASGRHTLAGNAGLVRRHPHLALAMAVALLSFMGLPPLAGFAAKFVVFSATLEAGFTWLLVVGLINTVLSLYYYLRVVAPMFLEPVRQPFSAIEPWAATAAVVGALLVLGLGLGAGLVLGPVRSLVLLH